MNSNFRLHNLIGFPIKDLILEMSSGPTSITSILRYEVLHHIINNKPPISHHIMMVGFHMSRNKLEDLRMDKRSKIYTVTFNTLSIKVIETFYAYRCFLVKILMFGLLSRWITVKRSNGYSKSQFK